MSLTRIACFLVLLLPIVAAVSCGQKLPPRPAGMPNPVPCTIIVQDESGSPIDKALVVLRPDDGGQWAASGATDSAGRAAVKTDGLYVGAVPGKYKVTVAKTEMIPTGQMSEEGTETVQVNVLIDPIFSKPTTTPFSLEVGAEGATETFKVKKP